MRVTGRGLSGGLPGGGRRGRSTTRGRSSRPLDRGTHARPGDRPDPTASTGRNGGAATSNEPAKPTAAGTPIQMPHRDYNELQLPYQRHLSRCRARKHP